MANNASDNANGGRVGFRSRVKRTAGQNGNKRVPANSKLTVNAAAVEAEHAARHSMAGGSASVDDCEGDPDAGTPATATSNVPPTPQGVRGHADLRSPGARKSPTAADASAAGGADVHAAPERRAPIPDFITQTDKDGRATTPRTAAGVQSMRQVDGENDTAEGEGDKHGGGMDCQPEVDACDSLLDSLRMMCCCLMPEDDHAAVETNGGENHNGETTFAPRSSPTGDAPVGYSTRGHDAPLLLPEDSALRNANDPNRIKLLPEIHRDDTGKKCLVLDLDETLVHSSFRAVAGADFVIPVQIEDVVHFVYVAKRPGVDEFLIEMAKHYEIIIYTASLNKYADPLLDLLDPQRVIRTRLFRESCVFYEGNYVKDMSVIGRDLSKAIIIDNSPSSYLFHPENAIDCSSFIDDPADRELDQIGKFLIGIKDVEDVRSTVNLWRHWPNVDLTKNHKRISLPR